MTHAMKFIPNIINYDVANERVCVSTCINGIRRGRIFAKESFKNPNSPILSDFRKQLLKDGYGENRIDEFIKDASNQLGLKDGANQVREQVVKEEEAITEKKPFNIMDAFNLTLS